MLPKRILSSDSRYEYVLFVQHCQHRRMLNVSDSWVVFW